MLPVRMARRVDGHRCCTWTSTLIASDVYWDGKSFERHGRNRYLYRARDGTYFLVTLSNRLGETDTVRVVTLAEAVFLYNGRLRAHEIGSEIAFPAVAGSDTGQVSEHH